MKFKELKAMPKPELEGKLMELKKELMKENAQVAIGTVPKNPRKLRNAKKTIAKINMILGEQSRTGNQSAKGRRVLASAEKGARTEAPKV